jgi:hypothetical protein
MIAMTGKTTSWFFISASIGSILLPWIIGRYVEGMGPNFIMQVLALTMLLAAAAYWGLSLASRKVISGPSGDHAS